MSEALELPHSYLRAFAEEQERVKASAKFWDKLTSALDAVLSELNKHTEHGKLGSESPSKHEFQVSYLGRELKLTMDHCEQRLFYSLFGASSSLDPSQEPFESGSLSLNRDDDGITLEGDADLEIRTSSMTTSKRSVQQQLAEQLLGKLTMPKWTDDRFDDTP